MTPYRAQAADVGLHLFDRRCAPSYEQRSAAAATTMIARGEPGTHNLLRRNGRRGLLVGSERGRPTLDASEQAVRHRS